MHLHVPNKRRIQKRGWKAKRVPARSTILISCRTSEFFPVVSRLHGATAILYLPPSFLNNSLTLWLWYTFEGGRRLHDWILSTTDQSTMGGVRVMASSCAVKMLAMVFQNNTKDLGWTPLLWAAVQKTCRGLFQMHPLTDRVNSQHSAHKHIFLWLI